MTSAPHPGATVPRLRELSGPRLYRRNAFRLTGVPMHGGGRQIRERRQKLNAALAVGLPAPSSDRMRPLSASAENIQAAFAVLADPRQRIVDELFWFWDELDEECGCPSTLHAAHDRAVEAHARVLDDEHDLATGSGRPGTGDAELWECAARAWQPLLRRAALWEHLRHRVAVLDDRRLEESQVDGLRDALPRALVSPVIALAAQAEEPARLLEHARRWDVGAPPLAQLLDGAIQPKLRQVGQAISQGWGHKDQGEPLRAVELLRRDALPILRGLEKLVPHATHPHSATVRNNAALLLNNSAVALGKEPGRATSTVRDVYLLARELATVPRTQQAVANNLAELDRTSTPATPAARPAPPNRPATTPPPARPPAYRPASAPPPANRPSVGRAAPGLGGGWAALLGLLFVLVGLKLATDDAVTAASATITIGAFCFLAAGIIARKRKR